MMLARLLALVLVGFAFGPAAAWTIEPPPAGYLSHGCYPGGVSGEEDDLTERDLAAYERVVGQKASWVYFSHNWYAGRAFPLATATWIRAHGAVPFIRLMLRSRGHAPGKPEREYSLQAIIDGRFDADLSAWARAAAAFGSPLLVEYGTEVNGEWFGWNGKFHGGGRKDGFGDPAKADGPERFVAAFRHVVGTMRAAGATNLTWVFHLDAAQSPDAAWNQFENYYPGGEYVQWIAVSCYGPLKPSSPPGDSLGFRQKFDPVYARIVKMAPEKPILIAEFGCASGHPHVDAAAWARAALTGLLAGDWPAVRGFSWWNERWENDSRRAHDTSMRVQDDAALGRAFHDVLRENAGRLTPIVPRAVSAP